MSIREILNFEVGLKTYMMRKEKVSDCRAEKLCKTILKSKTKTVCKHN